MADKITERIVVRGTLVDLFNVWANFENFPHFMKHIKSVTRTGERSSHWIMAGPVGTRFEWDAHTTAFEPNRRIAWVSTPESQVQTSGEVTFRELGANETEIEVSMQYDPPAGAAGEVVDEVFNNAEGMVKDSLRRFKDYIESTPERLHESDQT